MNSEHAALLILLIAITLVSTFNAALYLKLLLHFPAWESWIMFLSALLCVCVALLGLRFTGETKLSTTELHVRIVYITLPVLLLTTVTEALAVIFHFDRLMGRGLGNGPHRGKH